MALRFDGTFHAHAGPVLAAVMLPGGRALRTACREAVRTWDLATLTPTAELRLAALRGAPIQAVAFSPDGACALLCRGLPADRTSALEVVDIASGARTVGVRHGAAATSLRALALHPDHQRAALASAGRLDVLDLATGASRGLPPGMPAFTPEGNQLATLSRGRPAAANVRFRAATLRVLALEGDVPPAHEGTVDLDGDGIALHHDGARALLIGEPLPSEAAPDVSGTAFVVVRLDGGAVVDMAEVEIDPVVSCAFGPDAGGAGDRVALGYGDGIVAVARWRREGTEAAS